MQDSRLHIPESLERHSITQAPFSCVGVENGIWFESVLEMSQAKVFVFLMAVMKMFLCREELPVLVI